MVHSNRRLMTRGFVTTFALCCFLAVAALPRAVGAPPDSSVPRLPKIETGLSRVSVDVDQGPRATLAKIVDPAAVARIILVNDHGIGQEGNPAFDPDDLFARLFRSQTVSTAWGVDALERPVAEFLILTKQDDIYKVTILCQLLTGDGRVTGVLLKGKGFGCRFDFRSARLGS